MPTNRPYQLGYDDAYSRRAYYNPFPDGSLDERRYQHGYRDGAAARVRRANQVTWARTHRPWAYYQGNRRIGNRQEEQAYFLSSSAPSPSRS